MGKDILKNSMSRIGKIARWTVVVFCPAIDSFQVL
jgi:hypothetical protein